MSSRRYWPRRGHDHAIVEQVIAELKDSAMAHFPSASFSANGAWLACAVIAYLTRTALINIPARLSYSASTYTLHLPINSRRETPFMNTFTIVMAPTQAA